MDNGLQTTSLSTIKLSELPEAITLNESDYSLIVQNGTSKKIKGLLLKGNAGDNGKSIEIQKTDTHIQWRQEGGQWINLVALADLKGDKGEQGGGTNVDLTDYATKVWVTQQLASYYTKVEIDLSLSNKADISHTHTEYASIDHVHNYNDLTNKPTIPSKTSDLTNDSGFLTSIPSEYITETELTNKGYLTSSDVTNFATISDLNSKANASHTHVSSEITDLSIPAKISELQNDVDFATKIYVTNKIAEASLSGGEVDLSGYQPVSDVSLTTADKTIVGAINEVNSSLSSKVEESEVNSAIASYVTEHKTELKGDPGPQGIQGEKGETGATGEKGDKGDKGDTGSNGRDGANAVNPTFTIGTVTTVPSGSNATVTLTGTYPNLVLNFEIPSGDSSGGEGIDTSTFQLKTDEALETTDKTVVGAINELKNNINGINVPNKVSQLTNDLMYVTNSEVNELLKGSGITPPETDQTLRWAIVPETLELTAGVSKEINVTLNNTVTKPCHVEFGSNAKLLTFSGTDLFKGQNILLFKNDKTSNNITITANATDRRLVDYIYFGKYNDSGNYKVIPSKIKTIINPSSGTINVESVSLSQNSLSINKGETTTLNANILPEGATNKNVTWSTDNSNVSLTPSALSCEILGNVAGSSVVTVTSEDGNKTASCSITINETQTSETYGNIVLSKTSETVSENSTTTFTVKLDAPPTNNQTVNLSSNNSDVTLDKNSLVFTSSDYNVEQVVRITIAKDSDYDDDTCKITATSLNVANAYLDLTITDIDEAPAPSEPTGNIITDGLQVYIDGRDVERGSTQAYWSNKVEGSSLSQIPIKGQFGAINSGWNDITKTYGWLGDSFRYYLVNQIQDDITIPNFTESTTECTVEIGFLKEAQKLFDSINTVFQIFNSNDKNKSTIKIIPEPDGTVKTSCSVNGRSNYKDTSTDTAVKHYALTVNSDNTVNVYDNSELLTTLTAQQGYPFTYPFGTFAIAKGSYTQNVRVYYLRIYNRKLTTEEIQSNYQYESSIERSVN